ncbi:sialidase family protein [Olivibacter sitiensis]|uniref:sialidase family protein n=1 Tax=Olivibacter sitiensis TaxID=376470 RepID=UPI0003FEA69B|nr:sialidase family protein [Olivibacter sitiensis]
MSHKKTSIIRSLVCCLHVFIGLGSYAQTSTPPGVVVSHFPASGRAYIGSPSIAILPNGNYVASHDLFGPEANSWKNARTFVFESKDKGKTWSRIAELNQFWSGLFVHNNALYLMGTLNEEGDCVIRKSTDGGHSWTEPIDGNNGLLIKAEGGMGYHTSTVPVLDAYGRLWRGMEEVPQGAPWGSFKAFVMSVNKEDNLLKAQNWLSTNKLEIDRSLNKGTAWLEGNAVLDPQGQVLDMLRVHYPGDSVAARIRISKDGKVAEFNAKTGFVILPGATKKFNILRDPKTKIYYTLTNAVPGEFRGGNMERTRNTLYLLSSKDLVNWEKRAIILQGKNVAKHGFQYIDWKFEGNEIIFVSRTAYDDEFGGADNQHNANYLTFHRIKDFRKIPVLD